MKYKLPTLLLILTFPILLTACTLQDLPVIGAYLGGSSNSEPVTLTVWGLWDSPEAMQELIASYTELHPNVTINYEDKSALKPLGAYKDRVYTRIQEEDSPDIMLVHASWVPRLIRAGVLSPMPSKLMDVATYASTFYPVAGEQAVSDNAVYAVPLHYDGLALVYNRDHFAEVGQQAPPTAWEEFRRLALELSVYSDDNLIRAGAAIGTADNIDHFSDILGLMWTQANVSVPDTVDSRAAQDALTYYTNFVREDRVWSPDFPEASLAFARGQVSMIFVPSWQLVDILRSAPNINMGVAPVPQIMPDAPKAWASFWMDVVPVHSKHPDVAWDFLTFLTERDQEMRLFELSSNYRPFGSPYSRQDLAEELALNDYLRPYTLDAPNAHTGVIAGRAGNTREVDALRTAVNASLSGLTSEEVLTQFKATLEK